MAMDIFSVIRRPRNSEKAHEYIEEHNTYVFEVAMDATKSDVKEAVEKIWGVKVVACRTAFVRGKARRMGRHMGKSPDRKKAMVRLAEGQGIDALR